MENKETDNKKGKMNKTERQEDRKNKEHYTTKGT
jgi:hypothetical protein